MLETVRRLFWRGAADKRPKRKLGRKPRFWDSVHLIDNRNFLFARWYGPVSSSLSLAYPKIEFDFPHPYSFLESSSELAPLIGLRGWSSSAAKSADVRVFNEFKKQAYSSFTLHPYRVDESGPPDASDFLLHRSRETGANVNRRVVFGRYGGRCDRCGTPLDPRFFQTHEIKKASFFAGGGSECVPMCGDCHSMMEGHGGEFARTYGKPLYRTKTGKIHREYYWHLQRQENITQVWPDLERRWESLEDLELYSERELALMRQVNVGVPCKICFKGLADHWPDLRSRFEQFISATADLYVGHGRFNRPLIDRPPRREEDHHIAVCGGTMGSGPYNQPDASWVFPSP